MFGFCNDGNQIQIRLLYCEAPPGADQATYHTHPFEVEDLKQPTFNGFFINYFQVKRVFKDEKSKELEARRLQHIR